MSWSLAVVLLTLFAGHGVNGFWIDRYKRSDDLPALQTVVEGNSQKLAEVSAQLSALQTKLSEYVT